MKHFSINGMNMVLPKNFSYPYREYTHDYSQFQGTGDNTTVNSIAVL